MIGKFSARLNNKSFFKQSGNVPIVPYGLPCVRELLRFLATLISPHDMIGKFSALDNKSFFIVETIFDYKRFNVFLLLFAVP